MDSELNNVDMDEAAKLFEDDKTSLEENEQRYEEYEIGDAEIILVGFSICARVCAEVVKVARSNGIKVGLIAPITLYPFPKKAFEKLKNAKKIIVVELNILKQMRKDVEYFTKFKYEYHSINSMSKCPTVLDIMNKIKEIV